MLLAISKIEKSSDRDYLDILYRNNYSSLHKLAITILHDEHQAEDTVTTAMLSLFSKIPMLRAMEERERVGYLRATVRNAALKSYNAQKRKNLTESVTLDSLLFSLPGPEHEDPANILAKNEEFREVHAALASLGERDRQLLFLKYSAQLTAQKIAQITDAPNEAAVQMRLSRARRKVLRFLEERGWNRG